MPKCVATNEVGEKVVNAHVVNVGKAETVENGIICWPLTELMKQCYILGTHILCPSSIFLIFSSVCVRLFARAWH